MPKNIWIGVQKWDKMINRKNLMKMIEDIENIFLEFIFYFLYNFSL